MYDKNPQFKGKFEIVKMNKHDENNWKVYLNVDFTLSEGVV